MSIKEHLTNIQLEFLVKHKITEDLLLDATGIKTTKELLLKMTSEEKPIAYNTSPCEKSTYHTFKTNGGHCPQCNTKNIGFALREYKTGFIYIVGSLKGKLLKIGLASNIEDRIKSLNRPTSKYGDHNDWEMLFYGKTNKSGKVERMIHDKLSKFRVTRQYNKTDGLHQGGELFQCSYNRAKQATMDVQSEITFKFSMQREKVSIIAKYQFPTLSSLGRVPEI